MEQDNLAAEQQPLLVEHGLAELHSQWIIFSPSVGAGETTGGNDFNSGAEVQI